MKAVTFRTPLGLRAERFRKSCGRFQRGNSQRLSVVATSELSTSTVDDIQSSPASGDVKRKVTGKTVVITGGSQGSGRATALKFAKEGYNVVVAAREPERLSAVASEVSSIAGREGAAFAQSTDICDRDSVQALAEAVMDRYESVDILVNNAGVCLSGPFKETSMDMMENQLAVNFLGAVAMTKAFQDVIEASKGTVLFVNSFGGVMPLKNMTAYSASKYALAGFADALRYEMKPKGVHVAQVHPGVINSSFLERAEFVGDGAGAQREQMEQMLQSGVPLVQQPEDIAEAVWEAIECKKDEIVVGLPMQAIVSSYRMFGVNPFALQ